MEGSLIGQGQKPKGAAFNSPGHEPWAAMGPIVGIGEILWDIYPDGRKVAGGAPFNFAFHCHQLGHPAVIVSRVGNDDLGRELRAEVRRLGISDECLQTDPIRPTGTVQVRLDAAGVPTYIITEQVAWDGIEPSDLLNRLGENAAAVCFGTLAQRSDASCETIQGFLCTSRFGPGGYAYRIFDVNLRQSYYDKQRITWSLYRSHTVKLNVDELATLAGLFGWPGTTIPEWVQGMFRFSAAETRLVIVTLGADGCIIYPERGEPICGPAAPAQVVDTVGAGDAFTAAMVCQYLEGRPLLDAAMFAVWYAARVCEHHGATPRIDRADVERTAFGPV
jgi:fructokinase